MTTTQNSVYMNKKQPPEHDYRTDKTKKHTNNIL